jgi:hypothetical protein
MLFQRCSDVADARVEQAILDANKPQECSSDSE